MSHHATSPPPPHNLWHHPGFRRLWFGKAISTTGSQVTFIALPLTAVLILDATAPQMGLLTAAGTLPYLLFSLLAGVWVDRLRRRPLLIIADVGRASLLITVPLAAFLGWLRIEQLYLVAFLSGIFTLLYDVTEESFLPSLIGRDQLVSGNSRLAAINSFAEVTGPGIGGGLVQWLTAPVAIAVDAISFVVSALFLRSIRVNEPPVRSSAFSRSGLRAELGEGLQFAARHPLIRPLIGTGGLTQFFGGLSDPLIALFLTRELGLPPSVFGLMYAVGSISGLVAAGLNTRFTRRLGVGRLILFGWLAIGLGWLVVALARGTPVMATTTIFAGMVAAGFGNTTVNIGHSAMIQAAVPDRLLGRVNATGTFIGHGTLPIGSLVGGYLAVIIGLRLTMILAGVGLLTGFLWILFSPVKNHASLEELHTRPT